MALLSTCYRILLACGFTLAVWAIQPAALAQEDDTDESVPPPQGVRHVVRHHVDAPEGGDSPKPEEKPQAEPAAPAPAKAAAHPKKKAPAKKPAKHKKAKPSKHGDGAPA